MTNLDAPRPKPAIYILTCDASSAKRAAYAKAEADRVFGPGTSEFVNGLVSDDPQVSELTNRVRSKLLSKRHPMPVEIATYGTHRAAWQTLLASNHDAAFVFEDDFFVRDTELVRHCWNNAAELLSEGRNLIKLFDFPRDRSAEADIRQTVSGIPIVKYKKPHAGLVGYIISREGAERFLSRDKVFRVVDEDIKYYWELGLDMWSVPGNPVTENSEELGGSLLEGVRKGRKRHLGQSIKGNILSIYRTLRSNLEFHRRHRR